MVFFKNNEQGNYTPEEVYEKLRTAEKYSIFYNAGRISKEESTQKQEEFFNALETLTKKHKREHEKLNSRYEDISARIKNISFFRA